MTNIIQLKPEKTDLTNIEVVGNDIIISYGLSRKQVIRNYFSDALSYTFHLEDSVIDYINIGSSLDDNLYGDPMGADYTNDFIIGMT